MRRLLRWLRLEAGGELSLTHLAVFVSLGVYIAHHDATAAGFATAMVAHYGYRGWRRDKAARDEGDQALGKITDTLSTQAAAIAEAQQRLNAMQSGQAWSAAMGKRGQ